MAVYKWAELTREEIAKLCPSAITILPVASIEQHGLHMATSTDTVLVDEVIARACVTVSDEIDILLAPTQTYGSSDHHLPFGGTLSLTSSTFYAVLRDLLRSLAKAGCGRSLLLNGHGGNAAICRVAADDASREENMMIVSASYWELIEPPNDVADFPGHAGKFETSLMLSARPELVHMERAQPSPGNEPPRNRGLQISAPDLWSRINGFTDDPRSAEVEIGEELLVRCAQAVAQALRGIAAL